jgi:hypothetical protein
MDSCSKSYTSPYDTTTFDDVKKNYRWILNIYDKSNFKGEYLKSKFCYSNGDIRCSTDSFDKFCEASLGQNIKFGEIETTLHKKDGIIASISLERKEKASDRNVLIICFEINTLVKIDEIINNIAENKDLKPIENIYNNYGTTVNIGDNAAITNINIGDKKNKIGFWRGIWQRVISSVILEIILIIIIIILCVIIKL